MSHNVYGVVCSSGIHTDVSLSEKGAKNYATQHGYTKVSIRYNSGYTVQVVAERVNNKWVAKK